MITSVDFNGAHWRLTIAGETAGLWSQEQEAKHRAAAIEAALQAQTAALEAQLNTLRNFVANLGIITQDEVVWVASRPHIHDQAWKLVPPEDER